MRFPLAIKVFLYIDVFTPRIENTFKPSCGLSAQMRWADSLVNGIATGVRCTLWVRYCTRCCEKQSDIWNMAHGLQECTEIIYVGETMRKWYKPSFNQRLLKLVVQAIDGEGVERSESVRRSRRAWATLKNGWTLDKCQGAFLSLETTFYTELSILWSMVLGCIWGCWQKNHNRDTGMWGI